MVSYYEYRVRAVKDIDSMLENMTPMPVIVYKISMKYGFSDKIIYERIKQIEDIKDILIEEPTKKAKKRGKK